MKTIIITAGYTKEDIDEVMTITNMSTGRLGMSLAHTFYCDGYNVILVGNKKITHTVYFDQLSSLSVINSYGRTRFKYIEANTTDEMYIKLHELSQSYDVDMLIHSAAVADYKPEFTFKMEDMAKEIAENLINSKMDMLEPNEIESIINNTLTNPKCKVDDSTKISSSEPNLTVKLELTPKIVDRLKEWYPDTKIVAFKLLSNVTIDDLTAAAKKIINRAGIDYVIANDIAMLRQGYHNSYLINKDDEFPIDTFNDVYDMYKELHNILNEDCDDYDMLE